MFTNFFKKKKELKTTKFSHFIREASSREKKKVFMNVARKSVEDQKRILNSV